MNNKTTGIIRLSLRLRNDTWYISAPDLGLETSRKSFIEAIDRIYMMIEDELGLGCPFFELADRPTTKFRFHRAGTEAE